MAHSRYLILSSSRRLSASRSPIVLPVVAYTSTLSYTHSPEVSFSRRFEVPTAPLPILVLSSPHTE